MTDLHTAPAVELAARIAAGTLSSVALVDAHIARIEAVNPELNAVVAERFAAARAEATAADAVVARGEALGPLHGVPCTIKECFELQGMPNSTGLIRRRHLRSTTDAPAVARLRAAGAIPLGVTNTSELCMWFETDNRLYGRTNNPYDPERIVGGSSGGEGAIVAAGGAPFGLGSDVGGSIRLPAYFNGVFGHKATPGVVPNAGQHPRAEGLVDEYLATGPLCRRAVDLWPLLQVLAQPGALRGDPGLVDLSGLRVFDVPDAGGAEVAPTLRVAQGAAAEHLRVRGARVQTLRIEGLRRGAMLWGAAMNDGNAIPYRAWMGDGARIRPGVEAMRRLVGRSEFTTMSIALALLEPVIAITKGPDLRRLAELEARVIDQLGDDGVILYPPFATLAPRHRTPRKRALSLRFDWGYTAVWNVLRLPVTQVPLGLSAQGLPLGLQVIAGRGNDRLTVAVARELERAFGGWTPPWLAGGTRPGTV